MARSSPVRAQVRGLSMRDVESLCEEAGLGRTSKSTVATICSELHPSRIYSSLWTRPDRFDPSSASTRRRSQGRRCRARPVRPEH